ncbi:DUF4198 domain-containing protein [Ovoidimarina sediminis]|uniref:DUF4198 domain-containing protein n=1 Tax=Ovoidimarina sediminis TaxID=3079856 RepID=UPI002909D513|nr:DUF4198 domain-containing protein [Rhodophyticola sp. MJ-SS7]MDU8942754.1 DUF4198 domain-containing protein [Rhodophyticola sp. MJ-SS7]
MTLKSLAPLIVVALSTVPALGHEFWIDPVDTAVPQGEEIVANIRVGQAFDGTAYSFFPKNFRRFEILSGEATAPVEMRIGDLPALAQTAPEGLAILVHETRDYDLTYREFDKFDAFVRHKDAAWVLDAHAARGLPETDFKEVYSRYAKSLVAVGDGQGSDRAVGLETELVAGLNPYTDDLSGGLPVTLYYQGAPWADAQIEVFEKAADDSVAISTVRTDAGGQAIVPVRPGHRYMLDAVKLREPGEEVSEKTGAVWESLWANLTFAVPDE